VISRPARPWLLLRLITAIGVAAVIATAGVTADARRSVPARLAAVTVGASAGSSTAIPGFLIQSSTKVGDDSAVSRPGYPTTGWYPVPARSTVFAGLLANHRYPDPFYSTTMKSVPTSDFSLPWWYRADLALGSAAGLHTLVDFSGVISAADVWVNGTQVATKAQVAGGYPSHELDLTSLLHTGTNSIAFKIYPNRPNENLTMGWIDWVQTPPDQNMGIVRDVLVRRSADVALRNTHVRTTLAVPSLNHADVTVKTDLRNDSAAAVHATVSGSVATTPVRQDVDLAAHQTKTVTIPVPIDKPTVWWPAGMGGQPLYDVKLTASVAGAHSDRAHERFGIRDVRSGRNASGARTYTINGRPLLIRGGGWSPDLFLRWNPGYVSDKLSYALDLGLNTIRLEGHLEPDEFFDMADRYGILTLPGWECCDKWEGQVNGGEPGEPWTAADYPVAAASMASEAARLRDHPSVISFLIGSDFAPDATIEKGYLDALNAADWPNPVIAAASDSSAPITGRSGMKMTGPYDWVPPNYWYDKNVNSGGAWGFNSETSAGPDVPTIDTLRRMMSPAELDTLWRSPDATQYHRSPSSTFGTLKIFDNALAGRYAAPTGLDDYVRKAQLAQYEAVRAQYEAYARNFTDPANPSTGVVYWMLGSGWTSLHWQLFDYYLDQNGSYYGAKKANEPLHVQYSYDNRSVVVVNQKHAGTGGLGVRVDLYNLDGTVRYSRTVTGLTAPGDGGRATALTVPSLSGLSTTYLARLILTDGSGKEIDRNVYWLSTSKDVIDWANNDWYYAPTSSYADLSGLSGMARASVTAAAASAANGDGTTTTTVTLRNDSAGKTPAFFVDAHIVDANGAPVLPIRWSDNEVSLWPGESITLTARYRGPDRGGAASVRVTGWNVPTRTVTA
jgi:exo-1,4-beta-D-glucosaminidase